MPVFQTKLAELTYKYLTEDLSSDEHSKLMEMINSSPEAKQLFEEMTSPQWLIAQTGHLYSVDEEARWKQIIGPGIRQKRAIVWWHYLSAAAIVFLVLRLGYLYFYKEKPTENAATAQERSSRTIDSLAKHNKAVLKLADQAQVLLDTAMDGRLDNRDSVDIKKKGDELIYSTAEGRSSDVVHHELLTVRGKGYKITLSDGSKVWLNAESTINFPTQFLGKERIVEISGEAYFEIANDNLRPFKVRTGNLTVVALGTKFNIKAFANEPVIKTTLLEGSVKVYINNITNKNLGEGQQIEISTKGEIKPARVIDVNKVIAWKDGMYHFSNDDIGTILRQVERWYDVQVTYEGSVPKTKFAGMFSRSMSVNDLILKLREITGLQLAFKNNVITVSP